MTSFVHANIILHIFAVTLFVMYSTPATVGKFAVHKDPESQSATEKQYRPIHRVCRGSETRKQTRICCKTIVTKDQMSCHVEKLEIEIKMKKKRTERE